LSNKKRKFFTFFYFFLTHIEKFLSLKAKEGSKDEMTEFCQNRLKELKEYLDKVSGNKK